MKWGEFETREGAEAHRHHNGGWIFVADCGRVLWFALSFTASAVMVHPATAGMNGRLI